jgi:hypothetical protein
VNNTILIACVVSCQEDLAILNVGNENATSSVDTENPRVGESHVDVYPPSKVPEANDMEDDNVDGDNDEDDDDDDDHNDDDNDHNDDNVGNDEEEDEDVVDGEEEEEEEEVCLEDDEVYMGLKKEVEAAEAEKRVSDDKVVNILTPRILYILYAQTYLFLSSCFACFYFICYLLN